MDKKPRGVSKPGIVRHKEVNYITDKVFWNGHKVDSLEGFLEDFLKECREEVRKNGQTNHLLDSTACVRVGYDPAH